MASSAASSDPTNKFTYIAHIVPAMQNLNVTFIVLEVGAPRQTQAGVSVRTVKVADPTGSINVTVWNELGDFLAPGDIYRMRNGYSSVYKGSLTMSIGKVNGEILKTGDFFMAYVEVPNMSEFNAELAKKYPFVKRGSPDDESTSSGGGGGGGSNASNNHNSSTSRSNNSGGSAPHHHKRAAIGNSTTLSGGNGYLSSDKHHRSPNEGSNLNHEKSINKRAIAGAWQRLVRPTPNATTKDASNVTDANKRTTVVDCTDPGRTRIY